MELVLPLEWWVNVDEPFAQRGMPGEAGFHARHRLLGQRHAALVGGGHRRHGRARPLPGHRGREPEDRVEGVQ